MWTLVNNIEAEIHYLVEDNSHPLL